MAKALLPRIWELWAGVVLISFAVLEWLAFRRRTHRTLSRALQDWLGVRPRRRWGRLGPLAFVAGWATLAVHVIRLKAEPGDG